MAAPVVTGTIALMLQANPTLTPNLVKAVLQFTAEFRSKYDHLTEGAGFLNARGAVQYAQSIGPGPTVPMSDPTPWSRHIIWANRRIGGTIRPDAAAWRTDVMWGAETTHEGSNIVWNPSGLEDDLAVWGTTCADVDCASAVWGTPSIDSSPVWSSMLTPSSDDIQWRWGRANQ
jgi:subtilisin family serine protease